MGGRGLKSALFVLSLGAMLVWGAASLRAENVVGHLSKPFSGVNPCTGESFSGMVDGVILLAGHQFPDGSIRAVGHMNFHGDLPGNQGSLLHISFEGTDQFTTFTDHVDWGFSGLAVTEGSGAIVRFDGVIRVYIDGRPAEVISWSPYC